MAIPNTNTGWSLQDVVAEIGVSSSNLVTCFAEATALKFDATYSGSKNSLLNFRNYGALPVPAVYGYLYNGYAAIDVNFAPVGWHVPTATETADLGVYLDGAGTWNNNVAGSKMKEVGATHWITNPDGTNSSNFTGLGSGKRYWSGAFEAFNNYLILYTKTVPTIYPVICFLDNYNTVFTYYGDGSYATCDKRQGNSIRLIKDDSTDPGTVTDVDGNIYDTVKIGTQVWTKQNWKCTKLNNGTLIPTVTDNTAWSALTTMAKCAYNNDEGNV